MSIENLIKIFDLNEKKRLDLYLFSILNGYSRSYIQKIVENGFVYINDKIVYKVSLKLKNGDKVFLDLKSFNDYLNINKNIKNPNIKFIRVLYSNDDFLIIYKPNGIAVHKSVIESSYTLVDWILDNLPELNNVGDKLRPSIVHRLDKDTSGLMILAKNNDSYNIFLNMFKNRLISKKYIAIVSGLVKEGGIIDKPITRDLKLGYKMKTALVGKNSTTKYLVLKNLKDSTILEVSPISGRTHQIRVHLSSINYPIIGDLVYFKASKFISRQALHAYKLEFEFKSKYFIFNYDIPLDMQSLINYLS